MTGSLIYVRVPFREFWLDSSGCEASRRIRCWRKSETAREEEPCRPLLLGCLDWLWLFVFDRQLEKIAARQVFFFFWMFNDKS